MSFKIEYIGDILIAFAIGIHLYHHPYAKVEESFNLQAAHDFLEIGIQNLSTFDHLEFPGVVPRTFLGPLLISILSWPFHMIRVYLGYSQFIDQYIVRAILGFLGWLSFLKFRQGVSEYFDKYTGLSLGIVFACQFHLAFYMTRTLPNTFALMFLMIAYGYWLSIATLKKETADEMLWNKPTTSHGGYICISLLVFSAVIFRCDVLVIAAPIGLSLLYSKIVTLSDGILTGIKMVIFSLVLTIIFDSIMWRRLLWPEGEVFFFNTIENKSSEWGTQSKHWYFTSALPRTFTATIIWMFFGVFFKIGVNNNKKFISSVIDSKTFPWLLPAFISVILYSILPHKELRFIFPAIPLFNLNAAHGLSKLIKFVFISNNENHHRNNLNEEEEENTQKKGNNSSKKSESSKSKKTSSTSTSTSTSISTSTSSSTSFMLKGIVLIFFILLPIFLCIFILEIFGDAARWNYPGGNAFKDTHKMFENYKNLKIHIDGAAAENGVSRFGELYRSSLSTSSLSTNNHHHKNNWIYSKNESLIQPEDFLGYDVLISGKTDEFWHPINDLNKHGTCGAFNIIHSVPGIKKMKLHYQQVFPYHYIDHQSFHHLLKNGENYTCIRTRRRRKN